MNRARTRGTLIKGNQTISDSAEVEMFSVNNEDLVVNESEQVGNPRRNEIKTEIWEPTTGNWELRTENSEQRTERTEKSVRDNAEEMVRIMGCVLLAQSMPAKQVLWMIWCFHLSSFYFLFTYFFSENQTKPNPNKPHKGARVIEKESEKSPIIVWISLLELLAARQT